MDYTHNEVGLMQKFVDTYRGAPEVMAISNGYVSFPMKVEERECLEALAERGLIEIKKSLSHAAPTSYRLSSQGLSETVDLMEEGKIILK